MAKNKKEEFVKDITNMEDDFAQWYTDVIKKTDMVDYSPVKGFMVIKLKEILPKLTKPKRDVFYQSGEMLDGED